MSRRHINTENASATSSKASSFAHSFLKKDSRPNLERKPSYSSSIETSNNENNKAINSLSSDALRRAVSNSNLSTCAETGQVAPILSSTLNQPSLKKTTSVSSAGESSSSESLMIIEHRKRPCGDGFTVHKYLRGKLLGKGGFAKVYKVTSLDTNKEYAIKIVPKANLVKSRARQKLQTEIKIHRTMKHANICEYKHFFEDKTNCYILLELCHNQSMNEMIKRRKYLTEEETRFFMLQIVDAVSFMHEANVIHRDLKLGNLFLNKHLNIKVGDFGLATRLDTSDEKRKTICGTPNYIAPEVINGDKEKRGHSFEVDTWSMGVICYTMIVGKPPYESTDVKSTYRRILANEYSFPEGKVSCHARELISSMLQTDPKMRPTLDAMRSHPFFSERIPNALPHSCIVSQPIWAVDEFGELQAVKPTSALDIENISKMSSMKQTSSKGKPFEALENIIQPKSSSNVTASTTAQSSTTTKFNIFKDVVDEIEECKPSAKQPSQNITTQCDSAGTRSDGVPSCQASSPVDRLADKMSTFGFDELRSATQMSSSESPWATDKKETLEKATHSSAATPKGQQTSPDDLSELEVMHNRLTECLNNYERVQNGGAKVELPYPIDCDMWGATKWVTRYVDYTSKYGLGFLLNDGSSGVYFNDSTKAVLSTDDDKFIYAERKKGVDGSTEPISSYSLADYPSDTLKKKVTLLQHFRSYLLEQQKRAEENGEIEQMVNFEERHTTDDSALVYMKKWIRTKHAMLFRLSNGTVQVLFYDLTEVLISSEGKLITFVDKEKNRFVHTIADVANKQQNDVQRRLKYAKEILSQLISGSKR
ncbi:hypothetical protein HJC23_007182 [Cyclotella cryptica]|uniref:Serine/threonine-protein kinase PLK n=1 Tax=Cyclotella cryptica TaxID=29204 RepID=A0ABD3QQK4_9STRA